jgi:hypothetical protein
MLRAAIIVAGLAASLACPAGAQFYSDAEMESTLANSGPDIEDVFHTDIIGNLPRELRPAAAGVRLAFPRQGPGPLAFYADPATRTIYMPLESIRFFDDLATLFAWVESQGCQPEGIQTYLWALLREGRDLPSPLRAFAIDRDTAFADAYTYDVSGKIVSSGLQFILAHEMGHLLLGHRGGLSGEASQAQEIAADGFALDHFARLGGSPMGVFWYYIAAWWRDPVGPEAEGASSHPVSPERIARLAERLAADPMTFAHGEADAAREAALVAQLAGMVGGLAELIDDDGMLTLMPLGLERDYPVSRLAGVCPTP